MFVLWFLKHDVPIILLNANKYLWKFIKNCNLSCSKYYIIYSIKYKYILGMTEKSVDK